MPIFLDIETIPQDPEPFMVPRLDDLEPPANYKKPESIAQWKAEKAASLVGELRERSSLEPLLGGTILAVGIAVGDKPPVAIVAKTGDEVGEAEVLKLLEAGLAKYPNEVLVTWNGTRFDLEYLRKRAIRHGRWDLARRVFSEKPWSKTHVDLFPLWQGHDRGALGKLHAVAAFLGIPFEDKVQGKDVARLYAAGLVDLVKAHVLEDVRLTRELYWRFRRAGWIVSEDPIPADLPVRPCRMTPRDELLAVCAELQVVIAKQDIRTAAEAAGIAWHEGVEKGEDGPVIDDKTTIEQLRKYLDALQQLQKPVGAPSAKSEAA